MSFAVRLAAARRGRMDAVSLAELASDALDEGEEEAALPLLAPAAARARGPRLWQWTGLLQRGLDDHAAALESFANAMRLAPDDFSIAHGHARVALEAGLDAVALFEKARGLSAPNGDLLAGMTAARLAAGRGDEAADELAGILAQVPMWLQGHMQLAQLRGLLGQKDRVTESLDRALTVLPAEAQLWRTLFDLLVRREDFAALRDAVARSRSDGRGGRLHADYAAIAAAELGEAALADRLFEEVPDAARPGLAVWRIRHLLRSDRIAAALPLIDRALQSDHAAAIWPYAAIAWQLAGDPRATWLAGDPRFVAEIDLVDALPPLGPLADLLRSLHVARGEYLDQSVRGGTQTDGPLFSRIDPLLRSVRAAVDAALQRYLAQLPPVDPSHPLSKWRRDRRIRYAGSWSVRLHGAGHHANHVHPQGWISSALYVALPERRPDESADAGWLTLGEPQAGLGLGLGSTRLVEPREGRLVLFPSWMWHGTRPFAQGERLTIAFDVAPPC